MSILSAQSIQQRIRYKQRYPHTSDMGITIDPFESDAKQACGLSYGLGPAGYDIRLGRFEDPTKEAHCIKRDDFLLVSALEYLEIPTDLIVRVCDKSSLARQGLFVQNTVIEPGWKGFLTLELTMHGRKLSLLRGQPIAQLIFEQLDKPTDRPYRGKYQDQPDKPVQTIRREQETTND